MNAHAHPTLTVERREVIGDLVATRGAVRVSELAERLNVSPATIRRDLETLEDGGRVRRVHGGAVAVDKDERIQTAAPAARGPSLPRSEEAMRMGEAVAEMVEEGETIFLGPGALPLEVARSLKDHAGVTVVTNGLEIAHWLVTHTGHRLIITGGEIESRDRAMVGQLARDALSSLRADKVILELGGVSAVEGLTEDSLSQAEFAQMLMGAGSQVVIVVPSERIGRVAAARVGPVASADVVVTGREAPSPYLWDLSEIGIQIVLA